MCHNKIEFILGMQSCSIFKNQETTPTNKCKNSYNNLKNYLQEKKSIGKIKHTFMIFLLSLSEQTKYER